MRYLGLCTKYGAVKTILSAYFLPAAIGGLITYATDPSELNTFKEGAVLGFRAGTVGFGAGIIAHFTASTLCSRKKIGLTRGGRIVRKRQATSYAIATAVAFPLFVMMNNDTVENAQQSNIGHTIEETLPASAQNRNVALQH